MYRQGYGAALIAAGLSKEASAFWNKLKIVPSATGYEAFFPGVEDAVGELTLDALTGAVEMSSFDKKFRGKGLGKKLYGHAMQRMPEVALASDVTQSSAGAGMWNRMANRPGYTVWKNPDATSAAWSDKFSPDSTGLFRSVMGGDIPESMDHGKKLVRNMVRSPMQALKWLRAKEVPATPRTIRRAGMNSPDDVPNWAAALPMKAGIDPWEAGEATGDSFLGLPKAEWMRRRALAEQTDSTHGTDARLKALVDSFRDTE